MKFTSEELEKAVGISVGFGGSFEISTDTRTIKNGDLYLPLKGANFNGEDFCENALKAGAAACFYSSKPCEKGIKVQDTLKTYLQIANFARQKYNPKVIAVTGSSGKTTTKEMIYSVLSEKFKTHKTLSNHNNEIGFCQTVLSMDENTQVLIVEMGMRGLGEIDLISKYAQPDIAVITNAGSAHIGRLGSLDNIARAKCEITKYVKDTLICEDNSRIKKFSCFSGETIYCSLDEVKIIDKQKSKYEYKNDVFELSVNGDYNIENSLFAIEIGQKLGLSNEEIKQGLLKYKPIEKRWEEFKINGLNIINDSYNANPESMKASVSAFLDLYKKPVVILGNMGELGENEIDFHKDVGKYLGKKYCKSGAQFITVGNLAEYIGEKLSEYNLKVVHFDNNIATSRYILDNINAGSTIFLKASRSMKFEEIIEQLKN